LVSIALYLYVEGGGDSKALKARCREGFRKFVEKAGLAGRMPRIVPCGGRTNAYRSFETALDIRGRTPMLLIDAEGPLTAESPWDHLFKQDGWDRPDGAGDDHCHLMVQIMESWFLADRSALESFYGRDFQVGALPANRNVEQIGKADVLQGLQRATRKNTKGSYHKGSHSFTILGRIDPAVVEAGARSAKGFLDVLRTGGPGRPR
jgi:hypothetical protein